MTEIVLSHEGFLAAFVAESDGEPNNVVALTRCELYRDSQLVEPEWRRGAYNGHVLRDIHAATACEFPTTPPLCLARDTARNIWQGDVATGKPDENLIFVLKLVQEASLAEAA